jgi:hypothetical protein
LGGIDVPIHTIHIELLERSKYLKILFGGIGARILPFNIFKGYFSFRIGDAIGHICR